MRPSHLLRFIALSLGMVLPMLSTPSVQAQAAETVTVTIAYGDSLSPAQIANARIAVRQMQTFFDSTVLAAGVEYSSLRDLFINPRQQGYTDAPGGYGDGIGAAASALNTLVHKTWFWDSDGIERPLFQEIHATAVRGDKVFGVFAVALYLDPGRPT